MTFYNDRLAKFQGLARRLDYLFLVWGPGDPGPRGSTDAKKNYAKRVQIQETLTKTFPFANVHFSEDPEMIDLTRKYKAGILQKEEIHAFLSDMVIVLAISRGTYAEIDHMIMSFSWFHEKAYILIPKKWASSGGLGSRILDRLEPEHIITYTDSQFNKCVVATRMAVEAADTIAFSKLIED